MKVKILRHKKDEVELAGSKRNDDVVVRVVEEEVEDSEGHSSDEGNMSDVWNGEREESGNEEQEVQRQKEKDLLFEREMRGEKEGKEKAATRARREELKGWKRISVDLGKDEVELAGSKRNDDVVVRVVEEEVEDSEGHSSDEGNMSDVWNSEREESGNEEQEVQRQKEKDLLFEREMRGEKRRKRESSHKSEEGGAQGLEAHLS
ncbi:hypothetical protein JOQ06_006553 [Pogonophryne albipinna]|uniref:Uncharacterized protein n=1 Tax=Pogonophryne albipinna TaxID=1090488 RepID=A0AAD6A6C7_9TELE|nr:hypothetical protein JOQ06_006553 [Pogonophryne albipinna]